jgi:translation elongation factor EF-G
MLNQDKAGTALSLDFDKEEQERGITIRSSGVSLLYEDWQFEPASLKPHPAPVSPSPSLTPLLP